MLRSALNHTAKPIAKKSTAFSSFSRSSRQFASMGKATAKVGGKVIAESDTYETVDGNIYFPPSSIDQSVMTKSSTTTGCPYKGTAHYYTIKADGKELKDAAWYYPEPKAKAMNIKDHVAFYKTKVTITS